MDVEKETLLRLNLCLSDSSFMAEKREKLSLLSALSEHNKRTARRMRIKLTLCLYLTCLAYLAHLAYLADTCTCAVLFGQQHKIKHSCQAKQSCQLLASNAIFGDACPGTQKYLEVHYQCKQLGQLNSTSSAGSSWQQPATPTTPNSAPVSAASTTILPDMGHHQQGGRHSAAAAAGKFGKDDKIKRLPPRRLR